MTAINDTTGKLIYAKALSDKGRETHDAIFNKDKQGQEDLDEAGCDERREWAEELAREMSEQNLT